MGKQCGRDLPADKCQAVSPCTDLGVDAHTLDRVSALEAVALPLLEEALQNAPGGSKSRRAESLSRALGHKLQRDIANDRALGHKLQRDIANDYLTPYQHGSWARNYR